MTIPTQVLQAQALLSRQLGAQLLGLYLYGSFVDGGLRAHSDIDLLAVIERPLTDDGRLDLMRQLLALSAPPGDAELRPLEVTFLVLSDIVPWRHPARRELQFGEWLRSEVEAGVVAPAQPDPDVALLVTQARGRGIALQGPDAGELLPRVPRQHVRDAIAAMMPEVARNWRGEEKHALLTLARMWVTLQTGGIVAKDVAAVRIGNELPQVHRPVLDHARAVYLGAAADEWESWQDRTGPCVRFMEQAIGGLLSQARR